MLKFKEGDKIRIKADTNWGEMEGYTGIVTVASEDPAMWFPYGVTMDDLPPSVSATCPKENWFMNEDELEAV